MKIFFANCILTYFVLVFIFDNNLSVCYAFDSQLKDDFSGYSISKVFSIANKFDESPQKRANALYYLAKVKAPEISEQLIDLYRQIKNDIVDLSNREVHLNTMSQPYSQYPNLFNAMCLALGSTKTPISIQFLRDEANPKKWDNLFLPSQAKSMSEQDIIDKLFRHYVFRGLLEAAVNNPEIFDEIESYSDEYLRGTKENVMSWLPEYKEKYYSIHPDKIPINGYILINHHDAKYSIMFLHWRIQNYFEKNKMLPEQLLDLTIPRGGDHVFLPTDPNAKSEDQLLEYFYVQDGDKWTYILASVGENGIFDIDVNKLKPGITNESFNKTFSSMNDDLFSIVTYIKPDF